MKTFIQRWRTLTKKEQTIVISLGVFIVIGLGGGIVGVRALIGGENDEGSIDTPSKTASPGGSLELSEDQTLPTNISGLSGQECENYDRRPIAVMLAGDSVARPLSGLSQADMVFEMPVITGSVTRLMAVYVCNTPTEVGSIRSGRHDYISLVRGWDAIYVHWGGSHFALDELKTGVRYTGENLGKISLDVDALTVSGPFFRKSTVPAPHNGFVSLPKVIEYANSKSVSMDTTFSGYRFLRPDQVDTMKAEGKSGSVYVGFGGAYAVRWDYASDKGYTRYWANQKDTDVSNNNQEVIAQNVVVMRASSQQIEGQYNTVGIYGSGEAMLYQLGQEKSIIWKKDGFKGTLRWYDKNTEEEITLVPGLTFVQVIEPNQKLTWESN